MTPNFYSFQDVGRSLMKDEQNFSVNVLIENNIKLNGIDKSLSCHH